MSSSRDGQELYFRFGGDLLQNFELASFCSFAAEEIGDEEVVCPLHCMISLVYTISEDLQFYRY